MTKTSWSGFGSTLAGTVWDGRITMLKDARRVRYACEQLIKPNAADQAIADLARATLEMLDNDKTIDLPHLYKLEEAYRSNICYQTVGIRMTNAKD